VVRIGRSASANPGLRTGTTALAIATPIGLAAFAALGPLHKGWARRAGTPVPAARRTFVANRSAAGTSSNQPRAQLGPLDRRFSASLSGVVSQTDAPAGAIVELSLRLSGGAAGQMRIRLGGAPLSGGGLSLTGSQVDLTAPGMPSALGGKVLSLEGGSIRARVSDTSGTQVDLHIDLSIDQSTGSVTGTVTGTPSGANG
jgi:hypothetical protein